VGRTRPDQVSHGEPPQKADGGHDISARLAIAEATLDAEREKTALLQRHLDDVRRMLPPFDQSAANGGCRNIAKNVQQPLGFRMGFVAT
jgi:hypothetical protein